MRNILVLVFFILVSFQSIAQKVGFGIMGGYNQSKLEGEFFAKERDYMEEARNGFHIGVFLDIKLSERMGLQPSLNYSTKGQSHTFTDYRLRGGDFFEDAENTKGTLHTSYLDFPVLFYIQPIQEFPLKFAVGPQISFALSGDYKYEGALSIFTGRSTFIADYKPKTVDFGFKFGAFGQVDRFIIGIFYQQSLNEYADSEVRKVWKNVVSQEYLEEHYPNKMKNGAFQISLGVLLVK